MSVEILHGALTIFLVVLIMLPLLCAITDPQDDEIIENPEQLEDLFRIREQTVRQRRENGDAIEGYGFSVNENKEGD